MSIASMLERATRASVAGTDRVLIIGAGDEYHHDDAVGHAVVRRLCGTATAEPSEPLVVGDEDGLDTLRDRWRHADQVILVAAAHNDPAHPGRIHLLTTDLPARSPEQGTRLVRELSGTPRRVTVYAVEGADFTPGTGMTRSVSAAVDTLVDNIGHEIRHETGNGTRRFRHHS